MVMMVMMMVLMPTGLVAMMGVIVIMAIGAVAMMDVSSRPARICTRAVTGRRLSLRR